nr:alpha-1,4 glucan phosphorylase L isozyme, chloroplastic/amyloplastic isoform X2 [Tanacetum cinerariifolium]
MAIRILNGIERIEAQGGEKALKIPNLSSLAFKIKTIYGNILGADRKMSSGAGSFGEAGKSCRNIDCDKASGSDSMGINNVESDNRNVHDHGNYGNRGTNPIMFASILRNRQKRRPLSFLSYAMMRSLMVRMWLFH